MLKTNNSNNKHNNNENDNNLTANVNKNCIVLYCNLFIVEKKSKNNLK